MKPFHTVAVPHRDILEGKLTMDVFAADLWETHMGRAPAEYNDPELFFKKTYITEGLRNLLDIVEQRVKGKRGNPVLQIQTPFGGGKTHALIAMYHKANEWDSKCVVIVGSAMSPRETLWGTIEKQLTGEINKLSGNVSPGREDLRKLLEKNQPILILIDELLEYTTKVAGVAVKDTSLAAQTTAFMQELTEVAGTLDKVCVVITLPSSVLEHYDSKAERMFQQLQKVVGRVEKIYTPVKEDELTKVIRRRLFSNVPPDKTKSEISEFLDYAEKEGILPVGREMSEYRDEFMDSYPFLPEVIETLYHRWGSLPTFQRTRGVLRLLSLVIYSLRETGKPYISLADFDLSHDEIRRELIKHIGNEFDSVIAADITNLDSGAKKVDKTLGKSFQGLMIGERAATSVFMYSFSGGIEKGAHLGEIKRAATTLENPSSVVAEAVEQLKSKLFFLQNQNDKYFFSNQPNLNRILVTKMENIKDEELVQQERQLIKEQISGRKLQVFLWPDKPRDIPDTVDLKLVITPEKNYSFIRSVIESKGENPRIFRNTMFFLCPSEGERTAFVEIVKKRIAYSQIDSDKTLNLTPEQREEVKNYLKKDTDNLNDAVRGLYRLVILPGKDELKEIDLGIPTYGDSEGLDHDVYEKLRSEEEILEKIAPLVIKERYLRDKDYVNVKLIYDSLLKTPAESRVVSRNVIESAIISGVRQGLFGLGELEIDGKISCRYFKNEGIVSFGETEIIIKENLANQSKDASTIDQIGLETKPVIDNPSISVQTLQGENQEKMMKEIVLKFTVPRGKISQIMGIMNFLQNRYQSLRLELKATDGTMSEEDYINKVKEALNQLGINFQEK